jgi:hypothetical protein
MTLKLKKFSVFLFLFAKAGAVLQICRTALYYFYRKGENMRQNLWVLFIGLWLCLWWYSVYGQENTLIVTVSDSYVSRYIWRGVDVFSDNDGAHQPSLDFTFPKLINDINLSFNLWASLSVSAGHENLEEYDYTVSSNRDFWDLFNLACGWTYYDYPNTAGTADAHEPWFGFTWLKLPMISWDTTFKIWLGYNFEPRSGGLDSGIYYSYGTDTKIPLLLTSFTQSDQTVGFSVTNWGQDGVADLRPSFLYATDLGIYTNYNFGKFMITPNVHYVVNHRETINQGTNEFVSGVNVSYSW